MKQDANQFKTDTHNGHSQQPFHLLLLAGSNPVWPRAVQRAASDLGNVSLQQIYSVDEAISCLVVGDPNYSHLLVETGCADDRIGELANLTLGESHNGTTLVMLGLGGRTPPRAAVVVSADECAVTRTLVSHEAVAPTKADPLGLEDLYTALAETRLQTRYQPIVRLSDGEPVGLEVLARLDHPTRGTLSPKHFIPQMERAGLSQPLTQAVVERAFADYGEHLKRQALWFALNFPRDTLMQAAVLEWLEQRRAAYEVPAERIVIELTESQPVAELDRSGLAALQKAMARLRTWGYGLALDDIGPAMLNHRTLFELPFTTAKLDQELVKKAASDPQATDFLAETVALAHGAGCLVVAEGVRDQETWTQMRLAGVDYAQGFIVGGGGWPRAPATGLATGMARLPLTFGARMRIFSPLRGR